MYDELEPYARELQEAEINLKEFIDIASKIWYDRFEKELYVPPKQEYPINRDDGGESHDRFFRSGGENFMYDRCVEAAKKAAGIE